MEHQRDLSWAMLLDLLRDMPVSQGNRSAGDSVPNMKNCGLKEDVFEFVHSCSYGRTLSPGGTKSPATTVINFTCNLIQPSESGQPDFSLPSTLL